MDGVLNLGDVNSSNDSGTEQSEETSGSDAADNSDELREVCDVLGADYEHAKAYVRVHGKEDSLVEFARRLENDDELWDSQEAYRRLNDVHRIRTNFLHGDSREYSTYAENFYGDSDDPSEGTYNFVQQQSRELDGNLIFYRALFPEPVTAYWDSDPVVWHEYPELRYTNSDDERQIDSHIFVTRNFADRYSDFTLEVDGEQRPRPPADSEVGDFKTDGGSSDSGSDVATRNAPFDPAEHTIPAIEDEVESVDYSAKQLRHALNMEKQNKQRKGAKNALRNAIDAAEAREDGSTDDDGGEQQDLSAAAEAGEANALSGVDIDPDQFVELREKGLEKDEIIAMFG